MATSPLSAISKHPDPRIAVQEIARALAPADPGLVIFFVSSKLDHEPVARLLQEATGAPCIGCTTAGEISSAGAGFTHGSLVALALPRAMIRRAAFALATEVSQSPEQVDAAVARLSQELGVDFQTADCSRYLGLVLIDGMSGSEETVMRHLGRSAFNQIFVGASAGDDLAFLRTTVSCGGVTASNAAALAVIELDRPFKILKTQSFRDTGRRLVATRATERERIIHEFDHLPAARAYAEATGVPVDRLAEEAFLRHPVGLLVDGEPYVRSPQQVLPDGSIKFYCEIKAGGTMSVLEAGDILADTHRAFEAARAELGAPSCMLIFNCILRYLDIEARKLVAEVGRVYAAAPSVGFNTYGEEYLGHINQTCTAVLLG